MEFEVETLSFDLNDSTLEQSIKVTDLGVQTTGSLRATKHLEFSIQKGNDGALEFRKGNLSKNIALSVKACAYRSYIPPLITLASCTLHPTKEVCDWSKGFRKELLMESGVTEPLCTRKLWHY